MKNTLVVSICLFISSHLLSQKSNSTNTLLWRISGKDLTAPSYLYGTIHLSDKKVFNLGDSLYRAIEQTEGFAAELDMNRVGMQMINRVMQEEKEKNATEPVKVKDVLAPEVWEKYKHALQEKMYKQADKITLDDLDDIESSLQQDIYKKGEMPTFLDGYLFGIARRMGKWVGGLEDLQDQMEHIINDDVEEKVQLAVFDDKYYRQGLDWMVKVYLAQQLDTLDAHLYREEKSGRKDYIMIKRNLKMARGIDSLSAIRPTFYAVGAAHLPGDSGVIALLRDRGYTVSPVFSSRKINPDKYKVKSKEIPWEEVGIKDSLYKLQMPGIAETMDVIDELGIDAKMFYDIAFMRMYMTLNIDLPESRRQLGKDSIYRLFRNRYAYKGAVDNELNITINGIEGKEYTVTTDEAKLRLQLFAPKLERVILNAVVSINNKALDDDETARFFKSFRYDMNFVRPMHAPKVWSAQIYTQHAFSVDLPTRPRETKNVNSTEGKIDYSFQHVDLQTQVFYGMKSTVAKEGMFETLDSGSYNELKETLKLNFEGAKVIDSGYISFQGYPAYKIRLAGIAEGEEIETSILTVARGNRTYYAFAAYQVSEESRAMAEQYLRSFKLLEYPQPAWKERMSPDSSFIANSYYSFKKSEFNEDLMSPGTERFTSYDSLSGYTFFVERTILPEWMNIKSDTGFLRSRTKIFTTYTDSIADLTVSYQGKLAVADFNVLTSTNFLVKRARLILNGPELFELFTYVHPQDLKQGYERYFQQFRIAKGKTRNNLAGTEAEKLSRIIPKADEESLDIIKTWWSSLDFSYADIPVLQGMMFKTYADFDSNYYTANMNKKIFDIIEELDTLHTSIAYIRKEYPNIRIEDEYVKPYAISYLSRIKTAESYSLINELLTRQSLDIKKPAGWFNIFDSLKLTATLYPEIMKYAGSVSLESMLLEITSILLDSGYIKRESLKPYTSGFLATIKKDMENEQFVEDNPLDYISDIKILGALNTPESNALLARYGKYSDRTIRLHIVIAQLINNQPVDKKTIFTLASQDQYRYELYSQLKRIGKLQHFPLQFRNQKDLGKGKMFELGTDDEEKPEGVDYIGEKIWDYKGKKQRFLLYKISYGEFVYLGVVGPYSLDSKVEDSDHQMSGIYWTEVYDKDKLDEQWKAYLKKQEELIK